MTSTTAGASRAQVNVGKILTKLSIVLIGAGVAYWLGRNLLDDPKQFFSVGVTGLSNGALYALIALGYTLVYGIIELINFAHGDLFMLGAVFSYFFLTSFLDAQGSSPRNWGMLVLTLLVVMAACAATNVLIERLAYRRLRDAPKLAPLITAVGVSFILQFIGLKWNGSAPRNFQTVVPVENWDIAGVTIPYRAAMVIGITLPLLFLLVTLVNKTKQGKAMRATAQDKDAAKLMGIDVNKTISFTFALGGAMAGAAGLMFAQSVGTVAYNTGFQLGLIAFTSAVLGGVGNLNGAVLGGFLIGIIQGFNDGLPWSPGQKWSQSIVFAILILLMVYRPAGLLGKATLEKV
jgi:branched-chain amino acid transport system permease protein